MAGFESRISGVWSNRSTNWATVTVQKLLFLLYTPIIGLPKTRLSVIILKQFNSIVHATFVILVPNTPTIE